EIDLIVGELRSLGGGRNGVLEGTQLVHEPNALGVGSSPNAPLSDRINLLSRHLAAGADTFQERIVSVLDRGLKQHPCVIAERTIEPELARKRRGADPVDIHSDLV